MHKAAQWSSEFIFNTYSTAILQYIYIQHIYQHMFVTLLGLMVENISLRDDIWAVIGRQDLAALDGHICEHMSFAFRDIHMMMDMILCERNQEYENNEAVDNMMAIWCAKSKTLHNKPERRQHFFELKNKIVINFCNVIF